MVKFVNCITILCNVILLVDALPQYNFRKSRSYNYGNMPDYQRTIKNIPGREERPLVVLYPSLLPGLYEDRTDKRLTGGSYPEDDVRGKRGFAENRDPRGKRDSAEAPTAIGGEEDQPNGEIENVSFEVPTSFRLNDSLGDLRVSVLGGDPAVGGCCGPRLPQPPMQPQRPGGMSMTIVIENLFTPDKIGKILVTNSSELRGCGAMLKVNFLEKQSCNVCPPTDFLFDNSTGVERIESQKKKKIDDDEDDEKTSDSKTLEDILRRILTGVNNSSSESLFSKNTTNDPVTIVVDSRVLHKITGKMDSSTVKGTDGGSRPPLKTAPDRGPDTFGEPDPLLHLVERLSSNLPRGKLVSLLSNLLTRVSPSSNQHK